MKLFDLSIHFKKASIAGHLTIFPWKTCEGKGLEKADSDNFEPRSTMFDHDSHPCDFSFSGVHGSPCPEDSIASEDGGCKCVAPCPTDKCRPDQRPFPVRAADPETPGSCCPLYKCLPSGN